MADRKPLVFLDGNVVGELPTEANWPAPNDALRVHTLTVDRLHAPGGTLGYIDMFGPVEFEGGVAFHEHVSFDVPVEWGDVNHPAFGTLSGVDDAPSDGNTYGRKDGAWAVAGGGGGTSANPSATVGLTAKNGSATTYMRSDAAPALDQSIAPTWTGQHTWSIEPRTTSSAGWRIYGGSYGVFWLLSGTNYYLMLTDSGNPLGGWNGLRPMYVDVTTGNVYFGHKASFAQFTITNRAGYTSSDYTSQGLWCSWNNTNDGGESNFVNNQGGGNGGFDFWNRTTGGTYQRLMTLGTGSSGVDSGGTTPNGKIRTGNLTASSLTLPGTTSQYVRGDGSLATMPTPLKGDKGDIGPQGPKGNTGNTGATGPQGPAGVAAGDVTYIDVRSTVPASNSANSGRLYLIY